MWPDISLLDVASCFRKNNFSATRALLDLATSGTSATRSNNTWQIVRAQRLNAFSRMHKGDMTL